VQELPALPDSIRTLTNEEAQRLNRLGFNAHTPENCLTCRGTKTFQWWSDASRTEVIEWKCNCIDQWRLHRYLTHSGVPVLYQRLGWGDLTGVDDSALELIGDYLEYADVNMSQGRGMVLYGNPGTGKTLLGMLILKTLIAKGHEGRSLSFIEMLDQFQSTFRNDEERERFFASVRNAPVLLLDDVGKEYRGRTERMELIRTAFDGILRHRVANQLPTIVTTNAALGQLEGDYGGVLGLIEGSSISHRFQGDDFRRTQMEERTLDEAKRKLVRPVVIG
jgi:DNA replication protein DnaC